ncbi:WXG100-like domain-containing protein [Sphaerisporangium corydalis]
MTLPAELESTLGLIGVPWPTEDEDRLRTCAAAYRSCATILDEEIIPALDTNMARTAAGNSGEGVEALADFWGDYHRSGDDATHLPSLALTLHSLADLHEAAAVLVKALKTLLLVAAAYVLAVLAWAAAAAAFTAGGSLAAARATLTGTQITARRASAVFRREVERFVGRKLVTAVEARLLRVMAARTPRTSLVSTTERRFRASLKNVKNEHISRWRGQSSQGAQLVDAGDGTMKIYKVSPRSWGSALDLDFAAPEVGAFRFSEDLGWDMVPTTTRWKGPRGEGSVQEFVLDARPGWPVGQYSEVQQQRAAVIDYVTANTDRRTNYLTSGEDRLKLIDHARAFPPDNDFPIVSAFTSKYHGQPLNSDVVADLRRLDMDHMAARWKQAGLEPDMIENALDRLWEVRELGKISGAAWQGRIVSGIT